MLITVLLSLQFVQPSAMGIGMSVLSFYGAMLCIRGASHGPVSVSARVRLPQVGVLSKRMKESSWFLAHELPSTRPTLC